VAGIGRIGFPLCKEQARSLIGAMEKAPYGKGSETVLDTNVRNAWQLHPSKFTLGTNWKEKILQPIVTRACCDLGVNTDEVPVEAKLYKMLCYEVGGHFAKHRDSEKEKGMFGTLIVQLEAAHEGGDLIVTHLDKTKTFSLSELAMDRIHYSAFYADCEHTLLPITSGIRLVLAYNLVKSTKSKALDTKSPLRKILFPSFDICLAQQKKLVNALKGYLPSKPSADIQKMYWKLEHAYTIANLSFDNLKGRDRLVMSALRDVRDPETGELMLDLRLVLFEGRLYLSEDMFEDVNCRTTAVYPIYCVDSEDVAHEISKIPKSELLCNLLGNYNFSVKLDGDEDEDEDEDEDDEVSEVFFGEQSVRSNSSYTGNEGVESEFYYHTAVLEISWKQLPSPKSK